MIKKILCVLLGLLSVVFLGVGIVYSACPVIPFAKYTLYDENGELEYFYYYSKEPNLQTTDDTPVSLFSHITFTPNKKLKAYTTYKLDERVNGEYQLRYETALIATGVYTGEAGGLLGRMASANSEYKVGDFIFKISNAKKTLTAKDGSYLEAKFNPTFIFYLVSLFSLAGLIGINYKWILERIKKIKPEENE